MLKWDKRGIWGRGNKKIQILKRGKEEEKIKTKNKKMWEQCRIRKRERNRSQ